MSNKGDPSEIPSKEGGVTQSPPMWGVIGVMGKTTTFEMCEAGGVYDTPFLPSPFDGKIQFWGFMGYSGF
jgi:hypothetical protein